MTTPGTAWLVRGGRGGQFVDAFWAGGFVSIGWARIAGLGDLRHHDEDELLLLLRAAHRGQPRADVRELLGFAEGMQRGDVVVTPDPKARDLLFGDVSSDYRYADVPVVGDHRHVRGVRWFGRWSRDLVEDVAGPAIRHYQRTVLELPNQPAWRGLAERVRDGAYR